MTSVLPELERALARQAEAAADAHARVEPLLAADAAVATDGPASRWRRRRLRPALVPVGVAAAGGLLAVLALPLADRTRLDVVAEARAALDPGRMIIHTVTTRRTGPQPVETVADDGRRVEGTYTESTVEHWGTARPLRYRDVVRERLDGRLLSTREEAYAARRFTRVRDGRIETTTVPKAMAEAITSLRATMGAFAPGGPIDDDPVQTLRALLTDRRIRPDGERTVEGRRVLRLVPADPDTDRRAAEAVSSDPDLVTPKEYLVDAATYAPVRVTYRFRASTVGAGRISMMTSVITFRTYERLDPVPGHERLLAIDPAGRQVVEAPDMFAAKVRPVMKGR